MQRRGDVWWVNFDPSVGGEVQKARPTVIISNDIANKLLNRVQVVPLTTNVDRLDTSEAYVVVNGVQHKAMANQVTTVSKRRISNRIGYLSKVDLQQVEHIIKIQLGLP